MKGWHSIKQKFKEAPFIYTMIIGVVVNGCIAVTLFIELPPVLVSMCMIFAVTDFLPFAYIGSKLDKKYRRELERERKVIHEL